MNYAKLRKIKKLYFGYEEISKVLGIGLDSAKVSAARYARQGFLVRLKRNLYILKERWEVADKEERFMLANLVQVPSYISLMTALDYYEVTTQMQRNFIESVALKRTKETEIDNTAFRFTKIDKKLYFVFSKEKGFFIATPEKAFLDALYLVSLRRYSFDLGSIDSGKLNTSKLRMSSKKFPIKTQRMLNKWMR